eukprot:9962057-Alexandrium_andersonii.AAC.1
MVSRPLERFMNAAFKADSQAGSAGAGSLRRASHVIDDDVARGGNIGFLTDERGRQVVREFTELLCRQSDHASLLGFHALMVARWQQRPWPRCTALLCKPLGT